MSARDLFFVQSLSHGSANRSQAHAIDPQWCTEGLQVLRNLSAAVCGRFSGVCGSIAGLCEPSARARERFAGVGDEVAARVRPVRNGVRWRRRGGRMDRRPGRSDNITNTRKIPNNCHCSLFNVQLSFRTHHSPAISSANISAIAPPRASRSRIAARRR